MNQTGESNRINILDLITLILSIYVLGALIVDTIFKLNPEVSAILNYFDTVICIVFFMISF